jgi:hypothetical protein
MLRAKIYINNDVLNDIQIVNLKTKNKEGETRYHVKMAGDSFCVYHNRADLWEELLIKVLEKKKERALVKIVETVVEEHIGAWEQLKDL